MNSSIPPSNSSPRSFSYTRPRPRSKFPYSLRSVADRVFYTQSDKLVVTKKTVRERQIKYSIPVEKRPLHHLTGAQVVDSESEKEWWEDCSYSDFELTSEDDACDVTLVDVSPARSLESCDSEHSNHTDTVQMDVEMNGEQGA